MLRGDPLAELDRQVELLKPIGIKVYPTSWNGSTISQWRMNDPKVAFPLYERALKHGIKVIAVHKAVPLGPVVAENAFNPGDLEGAAGAFPDLSFEVVHGGIAFSEETGWLLARFANIYINLEVSNIILERRPRTFSRMLLDLLKVGGMPIMDRLIWATGCSLAIPAPRSMRSASTKSRRTCCRMPDCSVPCRRSPTSTSATFWRTTTRAFTAWMSAR